MELEHLVIWGENPRVSLDFYINLHSMIDIMTRDSLPLVQKFTGSSGVDAEYAAACHQGRN